MPDEIRQEKSNKTITLDELKMALQIAEKHTLEQARKLFSLKEHEHLKYPIKFDLENAIKDLREHSINLTDDAKKYTDALETKLTEKLDNLKQGNEADVVAMWIFFALAVLGIISLFVGIALWFRPLAWIVGGISLLCVAYWISKFASNKDK